MKPYIRPSSLLFYLLCIVLFFIIGAAFTGITGAAKNQGLAGGAIVLMYGLISAFITLLAAIYLVSISNPNRIVFFNKILGVIAIASIAILQYRFKERQKLKEEAIVSSPMQEKMTPTKIPKTDNFTPLSADYGDGLGFFKVDYQSHPVIKIQEDINSLPTDSLVFTKNENGVFEMNKSPQYVNPHHLKLDFDVLYFKMVAIYQDKVELIADKNDLKTILVDKNKGQIILWPDFLLSVNAIEFKDKNNNYLYIRPEENAEKNNTAYDILQVKEVKGQWAKVELYDDNYNSKGQAWLRWKKEGKILISYSLFS
jgi:hypothetical protein